MSFVSAANASVGDAEAGETMNNIRDSIAASFRHLPPFRGKAHLGAAVGRCLIHADSIDCLTTIKMRDATVMRVDVRSRTERKAYWTGEYDAKIIARLSTCLHEGATVFDIGANVGFYSMALGNRLRPLHGKLYAFEPVPSNFERLVECVTLNNLEDVVFAHGTALGDEEGTISLQMENQNNASTGNAVMVKGKIPVENAQAVTVSAPITTLDNFVQHHEIDQCDLIKIDVEGAEVMFLRGAVNFLSVHRPIIYGEFNPYYMAQFGHSFADAVEIVARWDYRFFKQVGRAGFVEVKNPEAGMADMLLCPSEISVSALEALGVDFSQNL